LLTGVSGGLYAEARRDGGGDQAMRKAQLLMRQMQAELQKLNAENAQLKTEHDGLKKERDSLEDDLASTEKSLSTSRRSNSALKDRVHRDSDKYRTLMARYRDVIGELRKAQFKVAYMQEAVVERNQWIEICKANNDELYEVNKELLDRHLNRGFFDSLANAEPVTGLGRVRTENMAEEYRYKLDDLRVLDKPAPVTAEEAPATAGKAAAISSTNTLTP
jgi:chromosome segregation ATPase